MKVYDLPKPDDIHAVEELYLDLSSRYRNGEKLEDEELDIMDFANNILESR